MYLLDVVAGRGTSLVLVLALAASLALHGEPSARGRVVVTETETTILDTVEFVPGTARMRPSAQPILDAVVATLQGNPSIELVEVQAHTSGIGDSLTNLALSDERAGAVMRYLVHAGIAPARLVSQGYGDTQPIDRAVLGKNERISFLIVKRSTDVAER
jgi:outer membrane protein OmpA-like peptidoglycan-associated protein